MSGFESINIVEELLSAQTGTRTVSVRSLQDL